MAKRYEVHGVHEDKVSVAAKDEDGNDVEGFARVLVVELVPLGHLSGSIREFVRTKDDKAMEEARGVFEVGGIVEQGGYTKAMSAADWKAKQEKKKAAKP